MKLKFAMAALLMTVSAPSAWAATDNWRVSEGPAGSTKGVWTISIDHRSITGQAQMTNIVNQRVGYKLSGSIEHRTYKIARTNSSDGQLCTYEGKLSADKTTIQGSATCGGQNTPWVATPSPGATQHTRGEYEN